MRKILSFLLVMVALAIPAVSDAQNRWNVYAGGSINHLCEKVWIPSDKSYGWGGGAFIGGGYEINFNSHWSLTPQLEVAFNNNGAEIKDAIGGYANNSNWISTWSINIPVVMSFRFPVSDKVGLRIGAGPYLQEALAGRHYRNWYSDELSQYGLQSEKESMSGNFGKRFNIGFNGEVAIETGKHFSYMIRTQ